MMNSDAVSIIDSLHAKERELNQEKVGFIQFLARYSSCLIISLLCLRRRLFNCKFKSCKTVFTISKRAN